jgi:hypothetical protein
LYFWLIRIALLALISASGGSAVSAQTPHPAEPLLATTLGPGTTAWITDTAGREQKMRIVGVSSGVVTGTVDNDVRRVGIAEIGRVRVRQSDPVINGALIGAGAAVASGLFLCTLTEPWENCRDDVGPMVRIGAIGAGVGIGIDALIRGRKTIYEVAPASARIYAVPIVSRHARGLQITFRF